MAEPKSLEERAFYEDKEKGIRFVQNPNDNKAYDVFVGQDHFYVPDRVIPDLASPGIQTSDIRNNLQAMNPSIRYILETNKVTYEEFHIALLKVRNLELEDEIANILSQELF